jgi:putative membrane protein
MWDGDENGYRGGWQMMDGSGSAFAWLMMALVLLAVVTATVAIILVLRHQPSALAPGAPPESRARRALDERFARGEIDEDEYRRRRSVLLDT